MAKASPMVGAWSAPRIPTHDDLALFNLVMKQILGVGYKPIVVADQLVAGRNYCFLCLCTPVLPKPTSYLAEVFIHKPLKDDPHVAQIVRVGFPVLAVHTP